VGNSTFLLQTLFNFKKSQPYLWLKNMIHKSRSNKTNLQFITGLKIITDVVTSFTILKRFILGGRQKHSSGLDAILCWRLFSWTYVLPENHIERSLLINIQNKKRSQSILLLCCIESLALENFQIAESPYNALQTHRALSTFCMHF